MEDIKYNLASSTWDDKELASIQRVIDSGNYSMGKEASERIETEMTYLLNSQAVSIV